jgi:hypothetical protein
MKLLCPKALRFSNKTSTPREDQLHSLVRSSEQLSPLQSPLWRSQDETKISEQGTSLTGDVKNARGRKAEASSFLLTSEFSEENLSIHFPHVLSGVEALRFLLRLQFYTVNTVDVYSGAIGVPLLVGLVSETAPCAVNNTSVPSKTLKYSSVSALSPSSHCVVQNEPKSCHAYLNEHVNMTPVSSRGDPNSFAALPTRNVNREKAG